MKGKFVGGRGKRTRKAGIWEGEEMERREEEGNREGKRWVGGKRGKGRREKGKEKEECEKRKKSEMKREGGLL